MAAEKRPLRLIFGLNGARMPRLAARCCRTCVSSSFSLCSVGASAFSLEGGASGVEGLASNCSTFLRRSRSCSSICNICFFKFSSSDAFSCAKTAGANGPMPSANTTRSASARDRACIQTPHVRIGKAPPAAELSRSSTAQRLGYGLRGSEWEERGQEGRSEAGGEQTDADRAVREQKGPAQRPGPARRRRAMRRRGFGPRSRDPPRSAGARSEEHTSELQSLAYLVCRLLLEKKKSYKHHYEVVSAY